LMLNTDFTYAGGHQPCTLGNHFGCTALPFLVDQGNREMRRVGDNDIGIGHLGHHSAPGHGALLLADTTLDVGVAVAFLVFLPDVLARHAHLLEVAEYLPGDVYHHDK